MDKILSKKSVIKLLGCDLRTLDRYISLERVPYCHVGRQVLFSWVRLCKWLNPEVPAQASEDLEPEEKIKLEKERQAEETEETQRRQFIEAERHVRLTERADKTIAVGKRWMELAEKQILTSEEQDEFEDLDTEFRALGAEEDSDLEKERKEFVEFFSDIPVEEAERVYTLLRSRQEGRK